MFISQGKNSKTISFPWKVINNVLLAILLDYKRPWMLCLALQPGQKSVMILLFEVVLKLKLPKNHFNKKCATKILFLIKKKFQKNSNDF